MSTSHLPATHRSMHASRAANLRWAHVNSPDARSQATAAARKAQQRRWEEQADPAGVLPPDELDAAVRRLKTAHYRLMQLRSAQARAAKAS